MVITRTKKKADEPTTRITRAKKQPAAPAISELEVVPEAVTDQPSVKDAHAEAFIQKAEPAMQPAMPPLAPSPSPSEPASPTAVNADSAGREQAALAIVKKSLPWTAGAAFVPVPGVDLAAIAGVQLTMVSKLSDHYGVPFKANLAKSAIASLMAMIMQGTLAGGLISFSKLIPFVGTVIGIAALPAFATAGTYAIGKVFISHFEAGGTLLDFEPKKVEGHFRSEFESARRQAA